MNSNQQEDYNIIKKSKEVISELFKASLITFLIFYLLDNIFTGFISDYFNIDILLVITLTSGIITIIFKVEMPEKIQLLFKKSDYFYLAALSFGAGILIYYSLKDLGKIAYIVSLMAGIMIFLISISLLNDQSDV